MIKIYHNAELTELITDNTLIEGQQYFVDVENVKTEYVKDWIQEEQISSHVINYHPRNKVLIIRFDNVVGFVTILGSRFDIRSRKLYDSLAGNEQFKQLLEDIIAISNNLTYRFKGSVYGRRIGKSTYNFNDLQTFDYYYQLVFSYPTNSNLSALLNQCFKQPHSAIYNTKENITIHKSKRISKGFLRQIHKTGSFEEIAEDHPLSHSSFSQKTFQRFQKRVIPNQILNEISTSTSNTRENQFVKFFLEEINILSLRLRFTIKDEAILQKARRLQQETTRLLNHPFFKLITRLKFLPGSSTVLTKKAGYKELYYHFVQSKMNFRPLLEDQRRLLHNSRLKDISKLYEIWVFFKIASKLFGNAVIIETFNGRELDQGNLVESYTWEGSGIKLFYNKTFSYSNEGSYSVDLRPDVSLLVGETYYLFDAKYKSKETNILEGDIFLRIVQNADIHKMHSYLDAIPKAVTSIVIYPGTESIFYDKSGDRYNSNLQLLNLNGVGAIPLVPTFHNETFEALFQDLNTRWFSAE